MNFRYLAFAILFSIPLFSTAQRLKCLTDEMTNAVLAESPEKRALLDQLNREAIEYTEANYGQRAGGIKIIPTVFHIVHDYGSENLSKQEILSALEQANEELRGQNGNLSSVVSAFQGIIADTEVELQLAKIDVNGNCTDGITRTASQLTYGADEDVKDLINWNTGSRRYLQIWVVQSVGSGAGGYTYLPGTVNAQRNGIIIRAAQLASTISHEFGHWLNLKHTWGSGNDNANPANCGDDDDVSDTPNTIGSEQICNTNQMTCNSLDNVQNHMDYSTCPRMFTLGQKARMQAAANSTTGGRSTYWQQSNLVATGTNAGFSNSCVPNIDFGLDNALGCEGLEVQYQDNSWGADVDASWVWSWSFPGGDPSTSNDPSPTVTYPTAGVYDATLTITTAAGSDSETIHGAVVVTEVGGGIDGPFIEGMEDGGFPSNAVAGTEWTINSPGGTTWQRSTAAAFSGDASARINLRSATEGSINDLISPPFDFSDVVSTDAVMTFRLAHSNRTGTTHDERLRVYASRDCGKTWTLRYTKSGDGLNTAGGLVSGTFTPDAGDWREETVSLGTMAGEEHVLIKFEALSDRQSYLYIDDININPNAGSIGIEENGVFADARIYPNPINGNSQLELMLREATNAEITLVNVVGQQLGVLNKKLNEGLNRIPLSDWGHSLNAGVYLIRIHSDQGLRTVRFVKD